MTSAIDTSKPVSGTPTTASVRANFAAAASEITALQAATAALPASYQPLDATLTALAAVITAANKLIYATGADTFSTTDLSAFIRTLLDDSDAATARTTLGAQPLDATLTALAAVTTAADKLIYATGSDAFSTADLTAFGRTLIACANAAAALSAIGAQAADAELTALAGLTSAADKLPYFTGSGTAALNNFTSFARSLVACGSGGTALGVIGAIVPYFYATRQSSQTLTADAFTKVQLATEVLDSAGAYDNATNYRFLPATAGHYVVVFGGQVDAVSAEGCGMAIYKNGAIYDYGLASAIPAAASSALSFLGATVVQCDGSSDYIELFGLASNNATPTVQKAFMAGFRLA